LIRGEQRVRTRAFRASSQQKYDNAPQEKFDCDMRARAFDSARERRPLLAQRAAKGRRARRRQPIRTASGAARLFSQTRGKYGDSEDRGAFARPSVGDDASACARVTRARSPFASIASDCLAGPQPRAIIR